MFTRSHVTKAQKRSVKFYDDVGIVVTTEEKKKIEVTEYAYGELESEELQQVTYKNTNRYCAKETTLFPNQICREHKHPPVPSKMGTFRCRWGLVRLYIEADSTKHINAKVPREAKTHYPILHEIEFHSGDQYLISPNACNWFQAGPEGAVITEYFSTGNNENDIYTDRHVDRMPKVVKSRQYSYLFSIIALLMLCFNVPQTNANQLGISTAQSSKDIQTEVLLGKEVNKVSSITGVSFAYTEQSVATEKKVRLNADNVKLVEEPNCILASTSLGWISVEGNHDRIAEESDDYQGGGTIKGKVSDVTTGDPLPGASVMLSSTNIGAATDLNGNYFISNVPPGTYTIRATYIGYGTKEMHVDVISNGTAMINLGLEPVGIKEKEIVVTAQASGQNAAINQQLSSDQIENVVSAAKIKELPDVNAAESVGRLPGVVVLRNGGEGYEVSIRGLQPKYNQVTINGISMGSSNPNDRSTDLSMVSSDMLGGIEVKKSITADLDANVIGGVVNFDMREAHVKTPGIPEFSLQVQGGYNKLLDANNKLNNYKYVGTIEDRFLDDRFGIFAQADIERRNLTSNQLSASYDQLNNNTTEYKTTALSLLFIPRDRQRYNSSINMDFKLPDGKIQLMNFVSSSNTSSVMTANSYTISNATQTYQLSSQNNTVANIMNAVDFDDQFSVIHLDAKAFHTYSETKSPDVWGVNFVQSSQGLTQFSEQPNIDPQTVPKAGNLDFSSSYLAGVQRGNSFARQRALGGSLDLKTNVMFSNDISAEIKAGGKFTYQTRSYNYELFQSLQLDIPGALPVDDKINQYFSLPMGNYVIPMTYFIDPRSNFGTFLGGEYNMVAPLDAAKLSALSDLLQRNLQYFAEHNQNIDYFRNDYASTIFNYSGHEKHSAFYVMGTCKIGDQITIIPGIRYQNLQTTYTAVRGVLDVNGIYSYNHYDTTVTQNHGYWLPDVSVRYKPVSWFDVRLSYSNTLAYPDYNAIIPKIDLSSVSGYLISWMNYKLSPSRSRNYDAYLSFYNNEVGLFTAGMFLKQIDNLIYPWSFFVHGSDAAQYLPYSLVKNTSNASYNIVTYVNDSYTVTDYGLELDWQTHLWYLPGPLSGIVLGVNYTHVFSKAQYPYTYQPPSNGRNIPPTVDTTFIDRLVYQPSDIINFTLGFDYESFSVRLAFLYQSDIFTGPNFWPQLRSYTTPYRRWDISAKQGLPWFGLEIYGDINNINGANDVSVIHGGARVPIAEQDYGMTADVGLKWKF